MLYLVLTSNVCIAQELPDRLPNAIRSSLDRKFPGWKFLKVREDIRSFLTERVSVDTHPELIKGDFDGNKMSDYAMLIEHGSSHNEGGAVIVHEKHLLVYLNKGTKFKFYELNEPGEYLTLGKKDTNGFDWHANKKFKYANDSIEAWIFEKAGWAYVYKNGNFRYVYMLD